VLLSLAVSPVDDESKALPVDESTVDESAAVSLEEEEDSAVLLSLAEEAVSAVLLSLPDDESEAPAVEEEGSAVL
jgi:hypothetical protein